MKIRLEHLHVRPVTKAVEPHFRELMQFHHYLGDLAKIGHTLWYVATYGEHWVALLSFSAAAWKCDARDRWIDWDFRHQYGRLGLIANNSRFLILPDWHSPNLGSKTLALCQRRIAADWLAHFGKPLLLLETFVGKTLANAIDEEGRQTHVLSVIGHQTAQCYTQKKSAVCP